MVPCLEAGNSFRSSVRTTGIPKDTVIKSLADIARIHQTLRVTADMEAGIADHVRSLEEIAGICEYPVNNN